MGADPKYLLVRALTVKMELKKKNISLYFICHINNHPQLKIYRMSYVQNLVALHTE